MLEPISRYRPNRDMMFAPELWLTLGLITGSSVTFVVLASWIGRVIHAPGWFFSVVMGLVVIFLVAGFAIATVRWWAIELRARKGD